MALWIGSIVAAIWALATLAEIRANQRRFSAELDRITAALGIPRTQAMIRCTCGNFFAADLTGCSRCGRAKSADARVELVAGPPR